MPQSSPAPSADRRKSATLILDIFGMYVRRLGGWVSVADLVELMGQLGVESGPTRNAVSRMVKQGTLQRVPRNGIAGYSVAPGAEAAMRRADRRIYSAMAPADLDAGWVVLLTALPDVQRKQRDSLRKDLTWLGFGNIGNGVWIAPAKAREDLQATIDENPELPPLVIFEGQHIGSGELAELVASTWDLRELNTLYQTFLEECTEVLDRWTSSSGDDRSAFIDHTEVVHSWRKFPYLDPGLPVELLPADWVCATAVDRFRQIIDRLESPAERYVASLASFASNLPAA